MVAYCEESDVKEALQKAELTGALGSANVKPAIEGASEWLRKRSRGHWYDSGTGTTLVATSTRTATTVTKDVPSSPHQQGRQIHHDEHGVRYPVTYAGPYARVALPHGHVQTITTLEVRDRSGGVEDWTTASGITQGRGEDYYVQIQDNRGYGRSYLYLRAAEIGPRVDYTDLLTLDYDYGLDWQTSEWWDVKRGVAMLAGAELVTDDDVLAQIPDQGQLVGVDTQRQTLIDDAMDKLGPYLDAPVA